MWLGKPHPEQGQKGRRFAAVLRRRSRAARPSLRVGRWNLPATAGRDGWPPPGFGRETESGVQVDSSVALKVTATSHALSWGYGSALMGSVGQNWAASDAVLERLLVALCRCNAHDPEELPGNEPR